MSWFCTGMKTTALLVVLTSIAAVSASCVDKGTYYGIDRTIEKIAAGITDEDELVHFYGGIVRLAAHDFMDFNRHEDVKMGSDGCIDWDHHDNKGLWGSIWCDDGSCELTNAYYKKFSHMSKADYWIASANAVIRQLSVDQSLDLVDTFLWGREDAGSCDDQGDRIPTGTGCREIQDTLLDAMGLSWRDAAALLGAHTIGKGHEDFSGHEGYWMPTTAESLVFNKQYYEELVRRPWRPRFVDTSEEDFETGTEETHEEPQFMLLTDMCLYYDTDNYYPCCSRNNKWYGEVNWCDIEETYSNMECTRYGGNNDRMEAVAAVVEFLGGAPENSNNAPFYEAFTSAWFKATTNGHADLKAVREQC